MSDNPTRWARRAARIVTYSDSLERHETALRGRDRAVVPSIEDILVGYPWAHGDAFQDARAWAEAIEGRLAQGFPDDVLKALRSFQYDPRIDTALDLESVALERATEGYRPPFRSFEILDELRDVADRACLYGAEFGDPSATARAVALCVETLHEYGSTVLSDPIPFREIGVTMMDLASRICREPDAVAYSETDVDRGFVAERHAQKLAARTLLERIASTVTPPEPLERPTAVVPAAPGLDMSWLADLPLGQAAEAPSILVLPAAADGKKPKGQAGTIAGRRLPCVPMPDLEDLGRRLVERSPWAEAAIARIVGMMLGRPYAAVPNLLLVGPPGGGKTTLARDLATALGVPSLVYACSSASDSSFGGTAAQWSTARPSVMAQLAITSGSGNGIVVLDEVDKAPAAGGHNGSLREVLLGLAEPSTRRSYWDIGLECAVDLSGISLVATANGTESLRGPLLDRFVAVEVGTPRRRDLPIVVRGILDDLRADISDPRWIPDLDGSEIDALAGAWRGGSIRPLRRAVERIVALRSSPRLAH
ncbi:AAA family ATPase [Methylobacterium sp. BTF04]|uniref:AAA family ATPase n=1 Tax=Methylobacterium sp. BTF04 TaxID=2708300 RepID=UPI0013D67A5E|nr:AAA family ATPase [Methylobacterium sp. BTF04]NEU13931.1 AAA family ATPase [Methylobacterium sp. BTF04]